MEFGEELKYTSLFWLIM